MVNPNLTRRILISMVCAFIIGSLFNVYVEEGGFIQTFIIDGVFFIFGTIFIKMLKMLVVPLVFCSLICGIIGLEDIKKVGKLGGKAFGLYMITTGVAIALALSLAVFFGIGEGFNLESTTAVSFTAKEAPSFAQVIVNIVPSNILDSMAQGSMLQVIFICILFGIAIGHCGESGKAVGKGIAKLNDVMMHLVGMVMSFAPYGVFCLIAKTFSEQGIDLIKPMLSYFLVLVLALLIHTTGSITALLSVFKLNPLVFFKKMRRVQLFAFSTASSNATIPATLQTVEERLGVPNNTASFTIPFGATINMDGTAIMQGVATVFIANVYGIDLSMMDYLTVVGMAILASIGTAGVPGVGLIMLAMVFHQVGLPVEGIGLIIGVDRLLDMLRTAVNVTGDSAVSCAIAKSEKTLDEKTYNNASL